VVRRLPNHSRTPEFGYVCNAEANPVRYHPGFPLSDQLEGLDWQCKCALGLYYAWHRRVDLELAPQSDDLHIYAAIERMGEVRRQLGTHTELRPMSCLTRPRNVFTRLILRRARRIWRACA
jgi:hypothetical protein